MSEEEVNRKKLGALNKELDIRIAGAVLKKSWYVFPLILIIGLTTCFLYLRYTKPLYESEAVIQRSSQDEGKRILDIEDFQQEENLSQDVELLRSSFLLEKALRNLNLNVSYFSEGEILTNEKYLLSSYHVTLLELKDSSLVGKQIHVSGDLEQINLSFEVGGKKESIDVVPGESVNNDYFHLIFKVDKPDQFLSSKKENELYFVFNDYKEMTAGLRKHLVVHALNEDAKTIFISFESNNPALAKDVVASLVTTFFQYDLEKKSESSANVLEFIDNQLDTVSTQLKESGEAIQLFKDSSKVNDPELFTQRILDRSNEIRKDLIRVDLEYELMKEVEELIETDDRIDIASVVSKVAGTDYEALLGAEANELTALMIQKEDASYSVTDKNDRIKTLNRAIDSKRTSLFRTISSIRDRLNFQRNVLQDRVNNLEAQLYGIPAKELELSRLNRVFDLNEKYHTLLIEKKTQYAISKAGYTMDNLVLQGPSEARLISPNRKLILIGTVVLSILLSLIYLLIKYLTFNEIHDPEELKRLLPSSVGFLGLVPKVETDNKYSALIVHQQPKSVLAESCRHIRANLQFILDENKSNVLAVSSSVSGEGKTFAALNLAGIFTLSGKKVLVLDLDLRKPKVHHGFGVDNKIGMSNILASSSKVDWKDCLNKSEIDGLDFITAGTIPPNPSELIIGGRLDEVLEEFKAHYDLILIDNPPVGIVSDGISVLKRADCPIYVFRANYSKRLFTERVRELVQTNKLSNLFVILNGVEISRKGYGYAYGYGYGEYYSDEGQSKKKKRFWKRK